MSIQLRLAAIMYRLATDQILVAFGHHTSCQIATSPTLAAAPYTVRAEHNGAIRAETNYRASSYADAACLLRACTIVSC